MGIFTLQGKVAAFIATGIAVFFAGDLFSNVGGAPVARSGAPFESTCASSSCHSGTVNSGSGSVTIESDAPGNTWIPGQTYNFSVKVTQSSIQRWGFEVLSAYSAGQAGSIGTTVITNATETQLKTFSTKKYVTHRNAGSSGATGEKTWDFQWTAPSTDQGDVTFYVCGNAANNNGQRSGDQIYTSSVTLFNIGVGVGEAVTGLNAWQVYPTTITDAVHIRLENAHLSKMHLSLINANGEQVAAWDREPIIGLTFEEDLDISHLPAGIYFLEAKGDIMREVTKLVKF